MITDRDMSRKRLLDASEVLEALRPSMAANPPTQVGEAWEAAKRELNDACSEYVAAWGAS